VKLNDKIYEAIHLEIYKNESDNCDGFQDSANKVEVVVDEFAIGFFEWATGIGRFYIGNYSTKDLLEEYKKEKEL